ncbi:SIS domain-containing protein [Micromonospora terminaliae]|uniref:SIS domain-containing protein n=1 Tax=Micromonospora terminaliae TaxID=1914461 RepID=UPI0030B8AA46
MVSCCKRATTTSGLRWRTTAPSSLITCSGGTAGTDTQGDGLVVISGTGETPVALHLARLAVGFGADLLAVTTRTDSTLARLASAVIEVPTAGTGQFGGSLFEQSALLLLDAVVLDLTGSQSDAYALMHARHANLQ